MRIEDGAHARGIEINVFLRDTGDSAFGRGSFERLGQLSIGSEHTGNTPPHSNLSLLS